MPADGDLYGRAVARGSVAVSGVTRSFSIGGAAVAALDNIDLAIAPGSFVTIVGASGCGKSTLLRMIAGLDRPDRGAVTHDGAPITRPSLERGLVFQDPRLFPWLTLQENVEVALLNSALTRAERAAAVRDHIALVGLTGFEKAYPHQLSGGMAQRAAIARGLVNRPDVLLLDEPFGALDALTRVRLQTELEAIWAREAATMVLVTHDVEEAVVLGDRVVVMSPRPGRIREVVDVHAARPRDRQDPELVRLRAHVLGLLSDTPAPVRAETSAAPTRVAVGRRAFTGAAIGGALAATFTRPARAATLPVRIGFASIGAGNRPFAGGSPAATAHSGHYVEDAFQGKQDVDIKWFFFAGAGPAVNEAFANGQLDLALQGDLPSIIGRANGLKTKIVMATGVGTPVYLAVPTGSDITSVKALKGRPVSLYRGTNGQLAVDKVLAANGLSERDLKIINMDSATAGAALANHNIDAAFGGFELFSLQRQGVAKIVYTSKGDDPAYGRNSALLVTEDFANNHPDTVQTIVTATVKAAAWSSDDANRQAVFEQWAKSGYPAESFRDDFDGSSLKARSSPLIDPFLIEQYRVQAGMAHEYKLLRRDIDVNGWFDDRFVKHALAELGLTTFWTARDAQGHAIAR
jgi:sulfonate transport system substrate-binding protein